MRQVWIPRTGGPEVLEVREAPTPEPGRGRVRVAVEAAGVNFADVLARQGLYPDAPPLPAVVGYEVAGRVDAVGEGVDALAVGDEVLALTRFGGYSSHVVAPAVAVTKRPPGMTAETGAALPVAYLTAFQMMIVMGGVRPAADLGRPVRVLVHSAAGGVGTACADLGRVYGAELYGTASPAKHDFARERGYAHVLDSRPGRFAREVRRLTGGEGVDLVLDAVGGRHWGESLRALAPTGRLVIYGVASAAGSGRLGLARMAAGIPWLAMNPLSLISRNRGVLGVNLGHLWHVPDRVAAWTRRLMELYAEGHLHPHVDRVVPFDEAAEAHRALESRQTMGKVLLRP